MIYDVEEMYNFSDLKNRTDGVVNWLREEYQLIRTNRATPAILDGVRVESYGSRMPINQLATISSEGPKTIRVSPWDMSQIKAMEKAIQDANLGLSVTSDDKGIRVHFPDLSEERRATLVKLCKQKLEEARISVKSEREQVWEDIQKKSKDGVIGEDDKFRLKDEMQKIIDEVNKKLEELAERKEREILEK